MDAFARNGTVNDFCGEFWIYDNSNETSLFPKLTRCLEHSVFALIPCIFACFSLPILLFQMYRMKKLKRFEPLEWSPLLIKKFVLTCCITILTLCFLIRTIFDHLFDKYSPLPIEFTYPMIQIATMMCLSFCILRMKLCGMVSSGIMHLLWISFAICGIPELYSCIVFLVEPTAHDDGFDHLHSLKYILRYAFIIALCILLSFADPRPNSDPSLSKGKSPELQSSFLNRLVFWWFNSLPMRGYRTHLTYDDLYELNSGSTSAHLVKQWYTVWQPAFEEYTAKINSTKYSNKPVHKSTVLSTRISRLFSYLWSFGKVSEQSISSTRKELKPPSIIWRLFLMFKYELLTAGGAKVLSDLLQFANPFFMKLLLTQISLSNTSLWDGSAIALAMFCFSELRSICLNYHFYIMSRLSLRINTTLIGAVYEKTLKLSSTSRKTKTTGEIINLMAIDVERFQTITLQLQQVWSGPFQITLALIYLFNVLGSSAICGIIVMILFTVLNLNGSKFVKRFQTVKMNTKDARMRMCSEILNGIRAVKLYAWEPLMEKTVNDIRKHELKLLKKCGFISSFLDAFNVASPFLVAMLSFSALSLIDGGHILTPQVAFVSTVLFYQLRSPMSMVAMLTQQAVHAIVANKRLKEFLASEELNPNSINQFSTGEKGNAIEIVDARFVWESDEQIGFEENKATRINLKLAKAQLSAIIGRVGSGKSTLLSSLLGETYIVSGTVNIDGKIAYIPQQPWIRNLTVRENIIFDRDFDQTLYDRVIEACALREDIKLLPAGDLTEIGEKGVNLSGGQKARISLARAVYFNADIYLLDDPLSAVDSHVGKHIFDQVIGPNGLLQNKTRVFVTNNIAYLKEIDKIITITGGEVSEIGSYDELQSMKGEFASFIEEFKDNDEMVGSVVEEVGPVVFNLEEDSESESYQDVGDHVNIDCAISQNYPADRRFSTVSALALGSTCRRNLASKSNSNRTSVRSVASAGVSRIKQAIITEEKAEIGRVNPKVYFHYIRMTSRLATSLFVTFFISFYIFQISRGVWLSKWSDANDEVKLRNGSDDISVGWQLGIYGCLGLLEVASFVISLLALITASVKASCNLHSPLLHSIMRAPLLLFDVTPIGRILNRFSGDIETIDSVLPMSARYFFSCLLNVLSTIIVISFTTPYFIIVLIPLVAIYMSILRFYVPTSRQIKRMESIFKSPIYSHFGESIQGITSIRAYNQVEKFCAISKFRVDQFIRTRSLNFASSRWLAIRLEFIGSIMVFFAVFLVVLSQHWGNILSAGAAGLSVAYALNVTETLNFVVRILSELESNIVSVERIKEYSETPSEAEWRRPGCLIEQPWPKNGNITFQSYSNRYRPELGLALNKISVTIKDGQKVGVVGRTGAGKSSFALALFRINEAAEGSISIDGVNIADIGLHDLRSNLTIIPQDPVLFSGTLRFNLDPCYECSDDRIWQVLELAHLKTFVDDLRDGLDHELTQGGENISIGQRQLICLARALLRRSKVLVLDEATAAVDPLTDILIQETIRREFKNSTVITIAHRLNTIMDYDRILVLDFGTVKEFDSPSVLLANRSSTFYSLAVDAKLVA